jgi:toxin ParE1/3/4
VDVHQYREVIERPWRILYRIDGDTVLVLAVLDGRRELRSLLLERLLRS